MELSYEDAMQAEFIVYQPHETNGWRWVWEVFLPHISGQPVLASGYGRDKEHTTQCALAALRSLRQYRGGSCLFGSLPER